MTTITNHEYVALELLDYGFALPQFDDAWPALIEKGWAERLDNGELHVTGDGRRIRCAHKRWQRQAAVDRTVRDVEAKNGRAEERR